MKGKSLKVTLRFITIIIVVVLIVLSMNYAIFLHITRHSSLVKEPAKTVRAIAAEFLSSKSGLTQDTIIMLEKRGLWVQLVGPDGAVLYNYNKPEEIGSIYSLKDIASFSRSYLKDYPVYIWESGDNLVILGYPKNTISKYNWSIPTNIVNNVPLSYLYVLSLNLIITVALAAFLSRLLTKPLDNIIDGISLLKQEQAVALDEKGLFKDLSQSINHTSQIIMDKNRKIKLRDTAVSNWIAGISHDIRTPLSMILGYSAMIEEDSTLTKDARVQAKIITENALRLRELIADLNLATSLQYELMKLKLVPLKLGNIARKALADCMNRGILLNFSTEVIVEDENAAALLDEALFLRALTNLITNSSRHNSEGCSISIIVPESKFDSHVSIVISDTGRGMSQDKIDKIKQYDFFNSWVNKSQGLGLIIVRSVVEAHKGIFIIDSAEGKGTKVTIKVPRHS
jgi:signal transduction histidine kinase